MDVIYGTIAPQNGTAQNLSGKVSDSRSLSGSVFGSATNMSNNHSLMINRSAPDQHPISSISGLEDYLSGIDSSLARMIDDWSMDDDGYLYLKSGETTIVGPIGPFQSSGGGGTGPGGSASLTYTITITNLLDSRVITVPEGERVVLKFNYSSVDEESIDDGPGLGQVIVGGIVRQPFSAVQGPNEIDITNYLASGTNNVTIRITNSENVSKPLAYTVTVAAVYLASSFDASVPYSGAINYVYTPTGIADKTVYFELDGVKIGTSSVTASGRQQSFTIPAQNHGSHILRVWFTCIVSGVEVSSNVLYYNLICTVDGNTTPIIAVTSPPLTGVEQYSNIVKKYRVYSPMSLTTPITLEVDGAVVAELTVDRTEQTWTYRADKIGEITQTIRCSETVSVSWTQPIIQSSIQVEAETEALALYLSSYGRSNNESNPDVWEDNGISAEFVNFNFASDGWKQDDEDITVLRVTGDARLNIPYKMFAYDFRTTGKTLEFELATRDVLNYDADVLTCYSGDRGFTITAQQLRIASEQSSLSTRYKENEHLRVTFVAEKKSENRLLLCYINGIMSGAVQYPEDDDFSQATPVGITVGSNDCTVDLYTIRAYDNSLTRFQVLDNWIADTQNTPTRLARYKRNDVYDAYGQVVIEKLPNNLAYLVLQCEELPQYKGDKKSCDGYFVDLENPERSYSFVGAQNDVQGTSSQYYYRKNYKLKYKGGFTLHDGSTVTAYQMNEDAIPTDTFTMKADVASSEGAFNVILSMLYNELCPFRTPAQEKDPKVRQTIEGFPIVIFWENSTGIHFLGKYNFNNDKGTDEVFGFKSGDESWEILQNGTDRVGWHSADFSDSSWKTDFEARYPEDNVDTTKLQALAEWLVSTDVDQATGNAIAPVTYDGVEYTTDTREYRLAKFSAELSDHFVEEAVIFYYLYTEIFLSIDQREKNAFPTYLKDLDRWIVLFYDADSSLGTDNKGNLTFEYYLEDIDYTEGGDPVYNGQNSVLWRNLRETRYDKIMEMYQEMRSGGKISYDYVSGLFSKHQDTWPEAIFNEDMYTKCLEPLILDGDGLYLPMLQGKKEQWIKWWLYNRFRYLDSKYVTGTSMENRITIRAHQKANVELTSYVNMYGHVYFNAAMVEHRMERGTPYVFEWPASGAEDPVIGINDADLLTDLGDLSPLMVELIDVSGAPHITNLKIGDGAADYANYSLNSVTVGNNKLLRTLDIRNCPNMTAVPDVSGCTNIEEIYAEGSAITGIKLPNGGVLKKLHLPESVVALQIINQPQLDDFSIPKYDQITTLRLENAGAASGVAMDILDVMPANSRVRLLGLTLPFTTVEELMEFCSLLDTMRGIDENGNNMDTAQISGKVHVNSITSKQLYEIRSRYPGLTVTYNTIVLHTVKFWNGSTLLKTVENVHYHSSVEYDGSDPIKEGETDHSKWEFIGWDPDPGIVTGDMDCYAQYQFTGLFSRELVQRTIEGAYENDRVEEIGLYSFYGANKLTVADFSSARSVRDYAFSGCSNLARVNMPNVVSVGVQSFNNCPKLSSVNMPGITQIPNNCFANSGLTEVNFPIVDRIDYDAFNGCLFSEAVFPSVTSIAQYVFRKNKNLVRLDFPVLSEIRAYYNFSDTPLSTLILRNEYMVCTLENTNAFSGTKIASGEGYIYVPRALVSAYTTATNWSAYADQIRAIEDYPEICGGDA